MKWVPGAKAGNGSGVIWSPQMEESVRTAILGIEAALDDRELVTRLLAGDEQAQGLFVERYGERLRRTCVHFLGWQDPDCEDLVQETFVLAFKHLRGFDRDRNLYSWLNKICVNLCFKRLKQRQRQVVTASEEMERAAEAAALRAGVHAEQQELQREALDLIRRSFQRLGEKCRQIVGLRDFEGKSYVDIARTLKLAPGTVFSRLARCREALRKIVAAGESAGGRRG